MPHNATLFAKFAVFRSHPPCPHRKARSSHRLLFIRAAPKVRRDDPTLKPAELTLGYPGHRH